MIATSLLDRTLWSVPLSVIGILLILVVTVGCLTPWAYEALTRPQEPLRRSRGPEVAVTLRVDASGFVDAMRSVRFVPDPTSHRFYDWKTVEGVDT